MYYRCQLAFELNKLQLLSKYDCRFKYLKKAIESIETEDNSPWIYVVLKTINDSLENLLDLKEESVSDGLFDHYKRLICRYEGLYGNISEAYKQHYRQAVQSYVYQKWSKMLEEEGASKRSFLRLFDEMHNISVFRHPEFFTLHLGDFKNLYRAQRGKHYEDYVRMIPTPETVKGKNRWNPPGVAFQYLVHADREEWYSQTINMAEKTCCEEIRLKPYEDVSICKFECVSGDPVIINFCYEDFSLDDLEASLGYVGESYVYDIRNRIIANQKHIYQLNSARATETFEKVGIGIINKEIDKKKNRKLIQSVSEIFSAVALMKFIDEAVFLPVDKVEDPELTAYDPFHYLAEYLQSKGYAGVQYKSTRMNKIGLKGKNLVLFNTKDVVPIIGSMHMIYYDGETYIEL